MGLNLEIVCEIFRSYTNTYLLDNKFEMKVSSTKFFKIRDR